MLKEQYVTCRSEIGPLQLLSGRTFHLPHHGTEIVLGHTHSWPCREILLLFYTQVNEFAGGKTFTSLLVCPPLVLQKARVKLARVTYYNNFIHGTISPVDRKVSKHYSSIFKVIQRANAFSLAILSGEIAGK